MTKRQIDALVFGLFNVMMTALACGAITVASIANVQH